MNESDLKHVQNDLEIMKQAVGLAPPALGITQVRGFLWLAFTGLLLIVIALFPGLFPHRWGGWLVLACWIALPVRGLTRRLLGKPAPDFEQSQNALPKFYSPTVMVFGVVFFLWARARIILAHHHGNVVLYRSAAVADRVGFGNMATRRHRPGAVIDYLRAWCSIRSRKQIWPTAGHRCFCRMLAVGGNIVLAVVSVPIPCVGEVRLYGPWTRAPRRADRPSSARTARFHHA